MNDTQRNTGPLTGDDPAMVVLRRIALYIRNSYDLLANDTEFTTVIVVQDTLTTARNDIERLESLFEKRRQGFDGE